MFGVSVDMRGLPVCTLTDHLIIAVPVAVAAAVGTYLLSRYFSSRSDSTGKVNLEINKDNAKVVHSFDIEDISKKAVYCRCWRSKKVGMNGGWVGVVLHTFCVLNCEGGVRTGNSGEMFIW